MSQRMSICHTLQCALCPWAHNRQEQRLNVGWAVPGSAPTVRTVCLQFLQLQHANPHSYTGNTPQSPQARRKLQSIDAGGVSANRT
jgi:hypothetical protein